MAKNTKLQNQEEAHQWRHETFVTHTLTRLLLHHPAGQWAMRNGFEPYPWYDMVRRAVARAREIGCTLTGSLTTSSSSNNWTVEQWLSWLLIEDNFNRFYDDVQSIYDQYGYLYFSVFPEKNTFNFTVANHGSIAVLQQWLENNKDLLV